MSRRLDRFLLSTVGRKFIMAATGLLLIVYLILHLAGNLNLYRGPRGEKFVEYAAGIHAFGALLYVGEVALLALFVAHIWVAFRLTQSNVAARPQQYAVKNRFGESTVASRSMFVTGAIVLGFIVVHLLNFRFAHGAAPPHPEELRDIAYRVFSNPLLAIVYLLGSIAVGVHVSHGAKSLLQSLGVHHTRWNMLFYRLAILLAVLLAVGFASFSFVGLFAWKGSDL